MDFSAGKLRFESADPFGDTSLPRVNLLATTDQADNRAPIRMAIHHTDKKLRLLHIEVKVPAFPPHEG